jgi:cell division protein FtsB
LIEKNMNQMTDNTREALTEIARARLDHSQEASRINEILDSAKAKGRQIADEINALNQQIRDFSVLSKHLEALHELALRASALNAQSLLVENSDPQTVPAIESSSRRMNDYIKEYFTKVFESDVLKSSVKDEQIGFDDGLSQAPSQKPSSRIEETIKNT